MELEYVGPVKPEDLEYVGPAGLVSTGMPRPSLLPREVEAAITPFLSGAVEGALDIPRGVGAMGRAIGSLPELDIADIARHPSQLLRAVEPIPGQMKRVALPVAGGIVGGTTGPWGVIPGMAGGEWLNQAIEQLWTGEPKTAGEVVKEGVRTGVGAAIPMAIPSVVKAATKLTGRGVSAEQPAIRATFERQQVPPSVADLSGGRRAAQAETSLSRLPTSANIMQEFQEGQAGKLGDAFGRTVNRVGGIRGRIDVGQEAVTAIKRRLDALERLAAKYRKAASQALGPGSFVGSDNLRAAAKELYDEVIRANPGLRNTDVMQRLDKLSWATEPAVKGKGGIIIRPARDLTRLTLDDWYANNKELGRLARHPDLIATIDKGRAKQLYKATMQDLEAVPGSAAPAVKAFKKFYKEQIVPFNQSAPGQLASGQLKLEDVGKLFSRTGIEQIDEVMQYAPRQFTNIRNRWLGDEFAKANIVDPQFGFQGGNFRNWWRRVDLEVKSKAFQDNPSVLRDMDDLAEISGRIGRKMGPSMGGGGSGTPQGMLPVLQYFHGARQVGGLAYGAATGNLPLVMISVLDAIVTDLGPMALAKIMTSPGGIRHMTRAMQIPAGSREGLAILSRVGIEATKGPGQPQTRIEGYVPAPVRSFVQRAQNQLSRGDPLYRSSRQVGFTDEDIQSKYGVKLVD